MGIIICCYSIRIMHTDIQWRKLTLIYYGTKKNVLISNQPIVQLPL